MTLRAGQTAPLFDARSDDGRRCALAALRGQWVVLYFFARAGAPGSTLEAQHFEAALPELARFNAQVIGVSTDTEAKQALFREVCQFTFPLLPDSARQLSRQYGVLGGWPGLLGRSQRCTYLIDPQGLIARVWRNVSPSRQAAEVLRELGKRGTGQATRPPAGHSV